MFCVPGTKVRGNDEEERGGKELFCEYIRFFIVIDQIDASLTQYYWFFIIEMINYT